MSKYVPRLPGAVQRISRISMRLMVLHRRLAASPLWLRCQTDAERISLSRLHRDHVHRAPVSSERAIETGGQGGNVQRRGRGVAARRRTRCPAE